jgi:hypothetical protein
MKKEELVAQSVACWMASPEVKGRDLLREALPLLDVSSLFGALKSRSGFEPSRISLAIAGFSHSSVDLEAIHRASGMGPLHALTDDLHVAAEWRNNRKDHPVIVSLAKGWHPGVSTLDHFGRAASKDLSLNLLDWAVDESGLPVNDLQMELLRVLRNDEILKQLSLDSICAFVAAWFSHRSEDSLEAPRAALPHLGLFADTRLFSRHGEIEARLLANFKYSAKIKDTPATALRAVERRLNQRFRRDTETRDRLLAVCDKLARVRIYPSTEELATVNLSEVMEVFQPPKDTPPEADPEVTEDDVTGDEEGDETSVNGGLD